LWSIRANKQRLAGVTLPSGKPDNWSLAQLADVAANGGIIKKATKTQIDLMRDFRNLIHPGRALRLSRTCTRATALAPLAAAEMAIEDLS
jgi:hypothetical protein